MSTYTHLPNTDCFYDEDDPQSRHLIHKLILAENNRLRKNELPLWHDRYMTITGDIVVLWKVINHHKIEAERFRLIGNRKEVDVLDELWSYVPETGQLLPSLRSALFVVNDDCILVTKNRVYLK